LSLGAAWAAISVAILWLANCTQVQADVVMSGSFLAWTGAALCFNTVTQEVLARSYIFQTIRSQTNDTISVIATAVLFMAYHVGAYDGSWLPPFNVFLAGILFGMAYLLTGNLWLPIGIHFIWNYLIGPVLGLNISGDSLAYSRWRLLTVHGPSTLTGGAFGLEGGLVVTLTTLLSIVVLFIFFRGRSAVQRLT
jgi:membrane protease YdiL (CAAX protease family)